MSAVLEKQAPREFNLALRVDESINKDLSEGAGLVAVAEACMVDCHDMALVAKKNLDSVIAFRKTLEQKRTRFIEPAKQIIEEANALFVPAIKAAEQAEGIYRRQLGTWTIGEQRRIEDARKKHAEEERARREQAERDAAAARARAEAAAAEARRKAEEATKREEAARAEGNARGAAAAAAARAKAEEEERQKLEGAARESERIRMEAAAAPTTLVLMAPVIEGLSLRDNWIAERTAQTDGAALAAICAAIAGGARVDLMALVKIDEAAINRLARALKDSMNVPGYRAVNNRIPVNRRT